MTNEAQEFTHAEIRAKEVFLSNTNDRGWRLISWTSKRRGQIAYDGNGTKLGHVDWFPVFVSSDELSAASLTLQEARRQLRSAFEEISGLE